MKKYWKQIVASVIAVAVVVIIAFTQVDWTLKATDDAGNLADVDVTEQEIALDAGEAAEPVVAEPVNEEQTADDAVSGQNDGGAAEASGEAQAEATGQAGQTAEQQGGAAQQGAENTAKNDATEQGGAENIAKNDVAEQGGAAQQGAENTENNEAAQQEKANQGEDAAGDAANDALNTSDADQGEAAAEETEVDGENEPAVEKSVEVSADIKEYETVEEGTKLVVEAKLQGFDGEDYQIKWYRSTDGVNWEKIDGENENTYEVELSIEDNGCMWSAKVSAGEEDVLAETAVKAPKIVEKEAEGEEESGKDEEADGEEMVEDAEDAEAEGEEAEAEDIEEAEEDAEIGEDAEEDAEAGEDAAEEEAEAEEDVEEDAEAEEAVVYLCGVEEHEHSEECYDEAGELICGMEEHMHDEACAKAEEAELLCGLEEHEHTAECYNEKGELICGLEEHEHSKNCLVKVDASKLKVEIWQDMPSVINDGDVIELHSRLTGFDGLEVKYQWQCDKGDGFEDVEGANEGSWSFEASSESLKWHWKLLVSY